MNKELINILIKRLERLKASFDSMKPHVQHLVINVVTTTDRLLQYIERTEGTDAPFPDEVERGTSGSM